MKKTICFLFLIAFSICHFAQIVEKTYHFDLPVITHKAAYQVLNLDQCMNTAPVGEPTLPWFSVRLLLPPGTAAQSVELIRDDKIQISGYYSIYPQQSSRPLSQPGPWKFDRNEQIYNSSGIYPFCPSGQIITQYLHGHAIAMTSFTPFEYIPSTGELYMYRKVSVKIATETSEISEKALSNLRSGAHIESRIEQLVHNYEVMKLYNVDQRAWDDYEILIVTPNMFAGFFDDLVQLYFLQGIRANVVSRETINNTMSGQDSAEKLRNYIIQEYQQHGIQYVLIGGDVDQIAYRGLYCYVESGSGYEEFNIPADLYFSGLDGNWNTDGDNKWGEPGEDDLLPEISVGRLTFSSVSELNNILNKLMKYQTEPVPGEFNDVLFAGEHLLDDPETWGSDYLELLIGYHADNGYETWGIPDSCNIERLYEEDQPWDAADIMAAINSGKQYVHHVGHANWDYVAFMNNWDISNSNFSGANGIDHNFTIFHSHGCTCGAFDENDCVMEEMLNISNFAVAVIGNSRYGWFNEGTTEGPAAHLHREMMDALYHEKIYRIGDAFVETKIQTAPWVTAPGQWEEGALRWNFYDINIMGDPAMAIWTAEPMDLDADYEDVMLISESMIDVAITWNSMPIQDVTCVISKDSVIYGSGITDANGEVTIVFDEPFTETGNALLSVSGNNCLPESFPILLTATNIAEFIQGGLIIYPNPAHGVVNITCPEGFSLNNAQVKIFDMKGSELFNEKITASEFFVNVEFLPEGSYTLSIENTGNIFREMLIIGRE